MTIDLDSIKRGPVDSGVHELILNRWSPRAYSDRLVSTEDLAKIFTAASWAASSSNEQPWRFLVGFKGDETYRRIYDTLTEFNRGWADSAPVFVLTVAKTTFTKHGNDNPWAFHDTGAASAFMSLQATALGLHTHGMAGFSRDKARELFELPDDYAPVAIWTVGYLGDPDSLPESLKEMETSPRSRKPLEELVFTSWNRPAEF